MEVLIAIVPFLPFLGFLILALGAKKLSRKTIAAIGVGSVGISAALVFISGLLFLNDPASHTGVQVTIWQWINDSGLSVPFAFRLDALSLVFIFVITFVGFLIHLYSTEFMLGDEGYSRFFAYMNLFVCSMLILVLADNLLLLYLGWEGVGLCSYLLIGFWYRDPENVIAANKAFIITRIGDTAMIIGLFLLFIQLGTLNIQDLMQHASSAWPVGSSLANWAAVLLLGGAVGKSAQLPLQTWLPDAMAGPSPVSALIHAATMVTAGVYLIARTNVLFTLAPAIQAVVAIIGALTLLLAGFSALAQHDLKRILAYSTISQIGYMFLALGLGAWSAAIFHFMTHAFFKALLFLAGGAVILVLHEEHDIFKMGGLRKKLPVVFYTFLIGSASLAALPLVTAGFFSKDEIIWNAWASDKGSPLLWIAAAGGAFLTALYTFRLVFVVFFGETKLLPSRQPGKVISLPLFILAFFSIVAGYIELPGSMGNVHLFSGFIHNVLPATVISRSEQYEILFQLIGAVLTLAGIYMAYMFFYRKPSLANLFTESKLPVNKHGLQIRAIWLSHFFLKGWEFDKLYDTLIVRPVIWISEINHKDFIDIFNKWIAVVSLGLNRQLSLLQNGKIRWYVMAFAIGIIFILSIMINV